MKSVHRTALIALSLILVLFVSGCKKRPVGLTHIPANKGMMAPGDEFGAEATEPVGIGTDGGAGNNNTSILAEVDKGLAIDNGSVGTTGLEPEPPIGAGTDGGLTSGTLSDGSIEQAGRVNYNEDYDMDSSTFSSNTVYFDFDRSNVRSSERVKVEEVGIYLIAQKDKAVLVDGHCDERGTEEYNRALGERRALSVREYLINLGIAPDRVFTRSFGEDAPAMDAQTDEAYAKNRRAEFNLLLPKN
jgi:outer membrane protein OmpA-like peptidoglycan-associated protein